MNPKIDTIGTKRWYNDKGELHRDNDLPAVEYPESGIEWCGTEDISTEGGQEWWVNGLLHRLDGLAVTWFDGVDGKKSVEMWYINDVAYTKEEHKRMVKEFLLK